jgi:predicted nucleotidyltransferase
MRLDGEERQALKDALSEFDGDAYLFGSRLDDRGRGGDIDLLLVPREPVNATRLSLRVAARFTARCEERIDVIVDDGSSFCSEARRNGRRVDPREL